MFVVLRSAVALRQPHPLAGDPKVPLRAADGVRGPEGSGIEFGTRQQVTRDGSFFPRGLDVAPRILQQRYEVVSRMPDRGGLEVDNPGAAGAGPLRQPKQIAGKEVTVHQASRASLEYGEHGVEPGGDFGAGLWRRWGAKHRGPPPVEQRAAGGFQHCCLAPARQTGGRGGAMHDDQRVDGGVE